MQGSKGIERHRDPTLVDERRASSRLEEGCFRCEMRSCFQLRSLTRGLADPKGPLPYRQDRTVPNALAWATLISASKCEARPWEGKGID